MASSQLHFFEFKAGQCRQWVEPLTQGLYVSWKAHNVNKGGELMGIDMLLADGKVILLTSLLYTFTYRFCTFRYSFSFCYFIVDFDPCFYSINVDRLNTFGQLLNEEALYNLSLFGVTRSSPNFFFTENMLLQIH